MKFFKHHIYFVLFLIISIDSYAQTKVELERYKKEHQQKLEEYKKKKNQEIEAYKKQQQDEIEKLRKEFFNYEKEREAEISSIINKDIDLALQKKVVEAEKMNKLNKSPQVVEIENEEKETNAPAKEPIKETEIKIEPKKGEIDKMKIEIEANRPVFIPVDKKYAITSHYNKNRIHPLLKKRIPHNGVDFGAPRGTPVYAPADGIIEITRFSKSAGNWVLINHQNGYKTIYMHFDRFGVNKGQKVKRGQVIGYVGNTGYSTAPHLHYEVRYNNIPINPINFLILEFS